MSFPFFFLPSVNLCYASPLRPEFFRGAPETWILVEQVQGYHNQGSFRDGDAVNLDSFFAHPVETNEGRHHALRLIKNLVQVLKTHQILVRNGGLGGKKHTQTQQREELNIYELILV